MTLLLLARFVLLAALAATAAVGDLGRKDGAMTVATAAAPAFRAAGATDPGLMRDANEDRFHVDVARGIFMVIDGVGGQAAGGEAAALALSMLRARLERETGPVDQRVREAIAVANNEIHRAAASRARLERHGVRAHGGRASRTAWRRSGTSATRGSTRSATAA